MSACANEPKMVQNAQILDSCKRKHALASSCRNSIIWRAELKHQMIRANSFSALHNVLSSCLTAQSEQSMLRLQEAVMHSLLSIQRPDH